MPTLATERAIPRGTGLAPSEEAETADVRERMEEQQVDEFVANLVALMRARRGRLVGVTVGAPPGLLPGDVARLVRDRLVELGHVAVEVDAMPVLGPLRLLRAEFLP